MRKLILIMPLVLAGCVSTLPMTDNVVMTDNKSFVETISFKWASNKNMDRTIACIRKEMPVLSNVQTQDVIRYIDKDNNEVVGDGRLLATKYDMMGLRSGNVKFQYQINVKKDLTTLTFKEIYSSYPSNNYTKMQPYSE